MFLFILICTISLVYKYTGPSTLVINLFTFHSVPFYGLQSQVFTTYTMYFGFIPKQSLPIQVSLTLSLSASCGLCRLSFVWHSSTFSLGYFLNQKCEEYLLFFYILPNINIKVIIFKIKGQNLLFTNKYIKLTDDFISILNLLGLTNYLKYKHQLCFLS